MFRQAILELNMARSGSLALSREFFSVEDPDTAIDNMVRFYETFVPISGINSAIIVLSSHNFGNISNSVFAWPCLEGYKISIMLCNCMNFE